MDGTRRLRAATLDDVPGIGGIARARELAFDGAAKITDVEIRHDLIGPDVDLALDTLVAEDRNGAIIGYGDVLSDDDASSITVWTPPGDDPASARSASEASAGSGAGHISGATAALLFAALEARAVDVARAGRLNEATVRCYTSVLDRARRALLADRGYAHVRTFHRMVLAPDAPVAPPVVPVGVALRPIDPTADAPSVHALLREAFAEHGLLGVPEDHAIWRHLTLDEPRWVPGPSQVAVADGAIVGAVLGFPEEEQGWIRHLGVSGAQRGRGLGAALLSAAFLAFRELGLPQVGLGVDSANRSGATRLYERVGMRVASEVELLERRLPI